MSVKLSVAGSPPASSALVAAPKGQGLSSHLLDAYLRELQARPLRTKVVTGGALSTAQELLATWLSGEGSKNGTYLTSRVPKMAIYGAFVSAPLRHYLALLSARSFAGATSRTGRLLQLVVNTLVIPSIQNAAFIVSMAIIAGVRSIRPIVAAVKSSFLPMLQISVAVTTVAQAFAQYFLPPRLWPPYFNLVGLLVGTYFTTKAKRRRLAAEKQEQQKQQ